MCLAEEFVEEEDILLRLPVVGHVPVDPIPCGTLVESKGGGVEAEDAQPEAEHAGLGVGSRVEGLGLRVAG